MSERATERDGEHVTAIKSDETGRWVRIPDGMDGVRAYQLLQRASTDAPTEERPTYEIHDDAGDEALSWDGPGYRQTIGYWDNGDMVGRGILVPRVSMERLVRQANRDRAPTDEAPERDNKSYPSGPTDDLPPPHPEREAFFEGWNAGHDGVEPGEAWGGSEAARRLRQPEPTREGGSEDGSR